MATIDREYVEALLAAANLVGDDNKLNDDGKQVLAVTLTDFLPDRHGPAFEPIKKAAGSVVAVEAVVVHEASIETGSRVLLGYRVHPIFGKGWHTFGTYPKSEKGESFEEAVKRAARDEAGVEVEVLQKIDVKDHKDNRRFPDAPILYLCRIVSGEVKNLNPEGPPSPNDCRWFYKCPSNMLPIQEDYRENIDREIERAAVPASVRTLDELLSR